MYADYIRCETADVKAKASVSAKTTATLIYGDEITVLQEKKNWKEVKSVADPSIKGWVPASSITAKKVSFRGNQNSANAKELALAGKGFNTTLEQTYAEQSDMDFSQVDAVEQNIPSMETVFDFIKSGKLKETYKEEE